MMDHLNQMDAQEHVVKVDLLHLNPADPDGGCCWDHGGPHTGRGTTDGQEDQPDAQE